MENAISPYPDVDSVLCSIRQYAKDHLLSPTELSDMFTAGIVSFAQDPQLSPDIRERLLRG